MFFIIIQRNKAIDTNKKTRTQQNILTKNLNNKNYTKI